MMKMARIPSQAALMLLLLAACSLPQLVHGHGYMLDPPSRNYVAEIEGIDDGCAPMTGIPAAEYCPFCLNTNAGLCGISEQQLRDGTRANYDEWLDSTKQREMPWTSQATYLQGETIVIKTNLWAHHGGHMELRACPKGRDSTIDCMDDNVLTFVKDVSYGMPDDPNYPERGYYYGGAGWSKSDFTMEFKLPDHLVGSKVLLQWRYITANSCSPVGYDDYFAANPNLPDSFWNKYLKTCPKDLPWDGDRSNGGPEQFFNCAEITILPNAEGDGVVTTKATTTAAATSSAATTTTASAPSRPTDTTSSPDTHANGANLIAYLANWLPCPSAEQYQHYTHVMIAFAVSYRWQPGKNICSATCDIDVPPICEGKPASAMVRELHDAGVKVLLSFGGAGMGGSWPGSVDDCWEYCFGREEHVVSQLVSVVETLDLDGIDIDYEYFYEDNQRNSGFAKGSEATHFLKFITKALRRRLPAGSNLVTHTPMDIDLVPGSAYFDVLKDVHEDVDFIMPQYYNGITRPVLEGVTGSSFASMVDHYHAIVEQIYGGDASKVIAGFCISDCAGTDSNANGDQAAQVMEDLVVELKKTAGEIGCPGGAFFWMASDDVGGVWSSQVHHAMRSHPEWQSACSAAVVTTNNAASTTTTTTTTTTTRIPRPTRPPTTPAPTLAPQQPDGNDGACKPCANNSSGECQKPSDGQCWPYRDASTRLCYPGTIDCGP